nr:MAG TPA: minor capsid protein [Caudoviricetes sp.]
MIDGKQHLANKKKAAAQRLIRTEAYAEKVRTLFAKTVNEILALNKTMPTLEDGVMYSFDGDSIKKQKEVEALLRRLSSTVTMAVQNGIKLEWDAANKECDQFVKSVFGKKVLSTPEFTAYMDRNTAARDAFIGRTENGLDLSKRVWKSVKQLREEMEVAMTVAIGEGDSASSMSRKVREYLNDPDLMFRRFRYKKGEKDIIDPTTGEIVGSEPIYGKKWKKRIKDEKTGKYKWIDYDRDTYKTGNGVYKSSARNAMRVTRTETNIAYRRADNARWQNMDFVIGQHIELSKSHPKKDICDDLAGDYPKDFVFDSWHPQCFCVCTPITIPPEETAHLTKMMLNGEDWRGEIEKMAQKRMITEYPQNFKDWVTDHKDKIEIARKNGTEPYFLRNNTLAVDNIINPQQKKLTPLEIAEKRHAARTPEQVEAIKNKVRNRAKSIRAAETYLDSFKDFPDSHTSALAKAYKHADWETVRKEALVLASRKRTIVSTSIKTINDAKAYKDIDVSALRKSIELGNIKQIQMERKKIDDLLLKATTQLSKLEAVITHLGNTNIAYNEVRNLDKKLTDDAIIKRVGGGDLTKGSCSSLAFTYAGNKAGLDVLDFRDGDSRKHFASTLNIKEIASNVGGVVNKDYNDFNNAKTLLSNTVVGKEYYFTCGAHAAIIRKTDKGFEYLELQSPSENGFKPLNDKILRWRFGAKRSHSLYGQKYETTEVLIDTELLKNDSKFRKMLGYINTASDKQRKSASGTIK